MSGGKKAITIARRSDGRFVHWFEQRVAKKRDATTAEERQP